MEKPAALGKKRYRARASILLQFPGEQAPLSATLCNLSEEGLFVVSEITYPAGTEFNFRVGSESTKDAITGRGRVSWRRQVAAGEQRPAGMGCQIVRLTEGSRQALMKRLDDSRESEVPRKPPERRSLTQEISRHEVREALGRQKVERPDYYRIVGGANARRKKRLPPLVWVASGLLLVLFAAFSLVRSGLVSLPRADQSPAKAPPPVVRQNPSAAGGSDRSEAQASNALAVSSDTGSSVAAESGMGASDIGASDIGALPRSRTGAEPQASPAPAQPSAATPTEEASASPTTPPGPSAGDLQRDALALAKSWAAAWSQQDVDAYLATYSKDFEPEGNQRRGAWAEERRRRVSAPDFIQVTLEDITFQLEGANAGRVTFLQTYRSESMEDKVSKSLDLVREDAAWRIVREVSGPVS